MPADQHPYVSQPPRARWRSVAESRHPLDIEQWYRRKFPIDGLRVGTAGSCFAQHIGRALRANGFKYVDVEPPPQLLDPARHADYGYGIYSARYGNVYTTRQLLQLLQRALGEFQPLALHWEKPGGFVDPFRPTLEPGPHARDEVDQLRGYHLRRVAKLFESIDVFVFTLGLTEAWVDARDGAVYPVAPGVSGGIYDPQHHVFRNFDYPQVHSDLEGFIARARAINPQLRFMLTVSPVPLMATATGQHVIPASTYSKSVLRAVAGAISDRFEYVDYFPSFEIVSSHPMRAQFFNNDMRTVNRAGVDHVMRQFFSEHAPPPRHEDDAGLSAKGPGPARDEDDIVCDEELIDAFGR